jgi:hypothetical protein
VACPVVTTRALPFLPGSEITLADDVESFWISGSAPWVQEGVAEADLFDAADRISRQVTQGSGFPSCSLK